MRGEGRGGKRPRAARKGEGGWGREGVSEGWGERGEGEEGGQDRMAIEWRLDGEGCHAAIGWPSEGLRRRSPFRLREPRDTIRSHQKPSEAIGGSPAALAFSAQRSSAAAGVSARHDAKASRWREKRRMRRSARVAAASASARAARRRLWARQRPSAFDSLRERSRRFVAVAAARRRLPARQRPIALKRRSSRAERCGGR